MKGCVVLLWLLLITTTSAVARIKVACIGNSITEGTRNYPTYLEALLGPGYQVEKDGVSGTTMLKNGDIPYWTKGRIEQVFAFKPDIVIIKLGTNDTKPVNWNSHHSEFKGDYLSMIDTLGTLAEKPAIFLVLPVPIFATIYDIQDSTLQKIIVIIKEIGAERKLPVIDVNTPLLGFRDYLYDGVHPTPVCSDSIAHIIYRAIIGATAVTGYRKTGTMLPHVNSNGMVKKNSLSFIGRVSSQQPAIDLQGRNVSSVANGRNAATSAPCVKVTR